MAGDSRNGCGSQEWQQGTQEWQVIPGMATDAQKWQGIPRMAGNPKNGRGSRNGRGSQKWKEITFHRDCLGRTAMGFRAQSSTLHMARLLQGLIWLQTHRGQRLWLLPFDLEKCFPLLPWWCLFEVLTCVSVTECTVRCLRSLYRQLRNRFRYMDLTEL